MSDSKQGPISNPGSDPTKPEPVCPLCKQNPHSNTCGMWSPYQNWLKEHQKACGS